MSLNATTRHAVACLVSFGLLSTSPALAQQAPVGDLGLQELLGIRVERVFGASRRLQPVTEAPSSVTIVTAQEIERLGYQTLADILRSVRGLYVSYDRNYSYLGTRGFSLPGDYNTKVLLLVDGHRMNDNIYDQAAIGHEFGLDVTTFDRVEIIRGPSSSLYGTSAFFAVVNVITKTGASHPGLAVNADLGSLGTRRASVSAGRRTRSGLDLFVNGSVTESDGASRLYFDAFDSPTTNHGIASGLDDEQVAGAFGQIALKAFTLRAAHSRREKGIPTAAYDTVFNDPTLRTVDERSFVDLQWEHSRRTTRFDVRTYVDRYAYDGSYPYDDGVEATPYYVLEDYARGSWFGVEVRASRPLPWRQRITAGGEYRDNFRQEQTSTGDPSIADLDIRQSSTTAALFAIDEITLHDRLIVNLGGRYDRDSRADHFAPRAALIVTPSQSGTFKYVYGRAFRAPNAYERDYYTNYFQAAGYEAQTLRAESITTHEIVWEQYTSDWFRSSVSAYTNLLDGLIRLDQTATGELFFINKERVLARGVEVEAEIRTRRGFQALSSYSLVRAIDRDTGSGLSNSPGHLAKARATVPLWRRGSSASAELQHLSHRHTLTGDRVDPATIVNLSVMQSLGHGVALSGRVHNLFDRPYADPASEEHRQATIPQNGRTFVLNLRWKM